MTSNAFEFTIPTDHMYGLIRFIKFEPEILEYKLYLHSQLLTKTNNGIIDFYDDNNLLTIYKKICVGIQEENIANRCNYLNISKIDDLTLKTDHNLEIKTYDLILEGLFNYNQDGNWVQDKKTITATFKKVI